MAVNRISLVAYQPHNSDRVFVSDPSARGRWILAPKCVIQRGCSVCGAVMGEPCFNPSNGKYWTDVHYARRGPYVPDRALVRVETEKPRLHQNPCGCWVQSDCTCDQ